jgi:hypothetical protein
MPAKPTEIPEEYARFQALLRQVVKPDPKPEKPATEPAQQ